MGAKERDELEHYAAGVGDEPIPGVEAVPTARLPEPLELRERTGQIKYVRYAGREKCADCIDLMYRQRMAGERLNPSVANVARYIRTRGVRNPPRHVCNEHHQMRLLQEGRKQ